jgi:hypothetical protein
VNNADYNALQILKNTGTIDAVGEDRKANAYSVVRCFL